MPIFDELQAKTQEMEPLEQFSGYIKFFWTMTVGAIFQTEHFRSNCKVLQDLITELGSSPPPN